MCKNVAQFSKSNIIYKLINTDNLPYMINIYGIKFLIKKFKGKLICHEGQLTSIMSY